MPKPLKSTTGNRKLPLLSKGVSEWLDFFQVIQKITIGRDGLFEKFLILKTKNFLCKNYLYGRIAISISGNVYGLMSSIVPKAIWSVGSLAYLQYKSKCRISSLYIKFKRQFKYVINQLPLQTCGSTLICICSFVDIQRCPKQFGQ